MYIPHVSLRYCFPALLIFASLSVSAEVSEDIKKAISAMSYIGHRVDVLARQERNSIRAEILGQIREREEAIRARFHTRSRLRLGSSGSRLATGAPRASRSEALAALRAELVAEISELERLPGGREWALSQELIRLDGELDDIQDEIQLRTELKAMAQRRFEQLALKLSTTRLARWHWVSRVSPSEWLDLEAFDEDLLRTLRETEEELGRKYSATVRVLGEIGHCNRALEPSPDVQPVSN